MNKSGIQAQVASPAFKQMVKATYPYSLKILSGARDEELVEDWAKHRVGKGGVLCLRYIPPDDNTTQIHDLPRLTVDALDAFKGWERFAQYDVMVILELPINEKFHTDLGQFADLAETSVPCARLVLSKGFVPGVMVISEGNPPGDNHGLPFFTQPRVLACLREFRKMGAVWCPHGYSHPPAHGDDEYHFARPKHILDALPEDCRLNYFYGEIGCDGGCDQPDKKPGVGFKGYFGPDEGRIKRYAGWSRSQTAFIAADGRCLGGAFFLSGADPHGNPNFLSFDVGDEVDFRPVLTEQIDGPAVMRLIGPATPIEPPKPTPTPPKPAPKPTGGTMPDIDLSSRFATEDHTDTGAEDMKSTHFDAGGPKKFGIVIHSTRSGTLQKLSSEFNGTVAYMCSDGMPEANRVSSHFVVGPNKIARIVHDRDRAWHASYLNPTHYGIEVAQPLDGVPYEPWQYDAAAAIVAAWCKRDGIPVIHLADETKPGIRGHEETAQGHSFGKSDPGKMWDWPGFMARVAKEVGVATPPERRPAPDPITAALDNLFDLTLKPGPNSEARRVAAQAAIGTIKVALGR